MISPSESTLQVLKITPFSRISAAYKNLFVSSFCECKINSMVASYTDDIDQPLLNRYNSRSSIVMDRTLPKTNTRKQGLLFLHAKIYTNIIHSTDDVITTDFLTNTIKREILRKLCR